MGYSSSCPHLPRQLWNRFVRQTRPRGITEKHPGAERQAGLLLFPRGHYLARGHRSLPAQTRHRHHHPLCRKLARGRQLRQSLCFCRHKHPWHAGLTGKRKSPWRQEIHPHVVVRGLRRHKAHHQRLCRGQCALSRKPIRRRQSRGRDARHGQQPAPDYHRTVQQHLRTKPIPRK